ncbi:hypothetical protein M406DRAFT_273553 [Cryphonectria parasitica EP155]|uniref:Aromatic amino acid beta-eliminating lyase/threonine aldolase domain-containing protein n=1 Tax=Cryphonectria parasitica (strain ATCC 38755 / EP155) TaxID=660469 RepID=A0A9P4Y8N4_CRYP1|nr:uncharacterized protein M406DRAFT_273553 [Cryphonectria parasitica EP155]KAF3768999.1 hypothetical protein M406DRAFT_273553 [Cryphonectria parasitica EP155]
MPAAKENAWIGYQGAAGVDLRSDTQTTPTQSMLNAIINTTLLDDVREEDQTTLDLEAHCASLTGKEAGLLMLSGTMGNQVALRALLAQPPHGVLCDYRSHIVKYEAGGVASLSGAQLECVRPSNGVYLTLEEIQEHAHIVDNVHYCPTRVISLENTLNGMLMPLSEVQRISAWAREHGVLMHCDGARLWEAAASGAGSLQDFSACFDTVTLCFSKGLGAPIGSILVGAKDVIQRARWVRKSLGGGLRQAGVISAAARVAVDETFGAGPSGEGGLLKKSHEAAQTVQKMWTDLGGKVVYPVHTNMVWLDLKDARCTDDRITELGQEQGLYLDSGRIVCHYQIYQNREVVMPKLDKIFKTIFEEKGKTGEGGGGGASGSKPLYK